jgi:hypothetical protein
MNERTLCFRVEVHREQLVLRAADKATGRAVLTKHVRNQLWQCPGLSAAYDL